MNRSLAKIYLAGGCFWGLEQYLGLVRGVEKTLVGYAGGHVESPSYEAVCTGTTGHAETVLTYYDPAILPLERLLEIFYQAIDPTSLNRQGNDRGSQYRTGIYYTLPEEKAVIEKSLARLQETLSAPVVVECLPYKNFFPAEPYHQKYLDKHPGGYCHITKEQLEKAESWNTAHPDKEALRQTLTPIQYRVTQENGTEPPFQNPYWDTFERGIYVDITTGEPLFLSGDKFQSGCGWPSFSAPAVPLAEKTDTTHGMIRTEVRSRRGDSHLGHLFPDGPKELGGLRYCINSAALRFIPEAEMEAEGYGEFLSRL